MDNTSQTLVHKTLKANKLQMPNKIYLWSVDNLISLTALIHTKEHLIPASENMSHSSFFLSGLTTKISSR